MSWCELLLNLLIRDFVALKMVSFCEGKESIFVLPGTRLLIVLIIGLGLDCER